MPTILVGAGRSQFANLLVGDTGQPGSLFLPDIEIVGNPQSHCAAGLSDVFGHGLPVFIENHPDIGVAKLTGRRVRLPSPKGEGALRIFVRVGKRPKSFLIPDGFRYTARRIQLTDRKKTRGSTRARVKAATH